MKETIDALIELQRVDDEILGHRAQRDELAADLDRLKSLLSQKARELQDKREKLDEATRFYEEKNQELQADSDRIARSKRKLNSVTNSREYAAMQKELEQLRRKYREEEQELERLGQAIQEYKDSIAAEEEKLADLEGEVAREEEASGDRLRELDAKIEEVDARKREIESRLDTRLARRYERVLKRRGGKAVVPAVDGKCTGCQMKLPPQTFIQVQRRETLETCPNCQRYLYFQSSEEQQEA